MLVALRAVRSSDAPARRASPIRAIRAILMLNRLVPLRSNRLVPLRLAGRAMDVKRTMVADMRRRLTAMPAVDTAADTLAAPRSATFSNASLPLALATDTIPALAAAMATEIPAVPATAMEIPVVAAPPTVAGTALSTAIRLRSMPITSMPSKRLLADATETSGKFQAVGSVVDSVCCQSQKSSRLFRERFPSCGGVFVRVE